MKKIKIKDIARIANVAISTVSHALNNTGYVKKETKERIKKIAEDHNYNSSVIASALRKKSLRLIALIVGNVKSPFFTNTLTGIDQVLAKDNYNTIILNTFYDEVVENELIDKVKNQFVDGIIFISGKDNAKGIEKLSREGFPFVLLMRKTKKKVPSVIINNFQASIEAVNLLCANGHKKIGYISMPYEGWTTVKERFLGYKKGLEINNIDYDPDLVLINKDLLFDEINASFEICKNYIKNINLATAIMTSTDNIALGLYSALKENSIKIPDQISVIGFDDIAFSRHLDPPLTTIKQPTEQAGTIGAKMLLKIVNNNEEKVKLRELDFEFIIRKSVKNINRRL